MIKGVKAVFATSLARVSVDGGKGYLDLIPRFFTSSGSELHSGTCCFIADDDLFDYKQNSKLLFLKD